MCISPIRIRHPTRKGEFLDVPCGKCLECVKKRTNDLTFRLIEEMKTAKSAYFFTLTYDDDNLPHMFTNSRGEYAFKARLRGEPPYDYEYLEGSADDDNYYEFNPCFYKKDVQNLIRSIRDELRYCKIKVKFKYFIASEYGEKSKRPHYHGIIFGFPGLELLLHMLTKHWQFGFVSAAECNEQRCYYATKYALKNAFLMPDMWPNAERCWILLSKGLGIGFLTAQTINYMLGDGDEYNLTIHQLGRDKIIPKYYRDKVFVEDYQKVNLKRQFEEILNKFDCPDSQDYFKWRDESYINKVRKHNEKRKNEKL